MVSRILVTLAFYCAFANLIGLVIASALPTYFRDLVIAIALLLSAYKISPYKAVIASAASGLLFIACIAKGISPDLLPKIRNYVAFPLVCLVLTNSHRLFLQGKDHQRWISLLFVAISCSIFLEGAIYIFAPEIQSLMWSALATASEQKGVSVGLGGGFINGLRAMTPLLSPVQGSFVLFTALLYMQSSRLSTLNFYAIHLLTVSKISLLGDLAYRMLKKLTILQMLAIFFWLLIIAIIIIFTASPETLENNKESIRIHISGAIKGILTPFYAPLGLPLIHVGAISINENSPISPGFESFLGSICAAFGIAGIAVVLICLLFFGFKSKAMLVVFLAWLLSDNVSSPHLFVIPIFWTLIHFARKQG
jgi:hypothetical protein